MEREGNACDDDGHGGRGVAHDVQGKCYVVRGVDSGGGPQTWMHATCFHISLRSSIVPHKNCFF